MEDCDEDVTGFGGGGGGEEEVELTVPRGEPLYVENLAGPLTSVPLFQSSILQELQDLEVELAPGSSQFCEEEDISVDELKILSEEELVEMAIKEVLKIVAVANLMPADDSVDELDSYMYQTVGHQIVISYAECMGVPLFRRRIQGSTRHQKLSYRMTPGDEVEDMFILLNEVKRQIPSVTAVSSGAIASDYQRLRVESVCSR